MMYQPELQTCQSVFQPLLIIVSLEKSSSAIKAQSNVKTENEMSRDAEIGVPAD